MTTATMNSEQEALYKAKVMECEIAAGEKVAETLQLPSHEVSIFAKAAGCVELHLVDHNMNRPNEKIFYDISKECLADLGVYVDHNTITRLYTFYFASRTEMGKCIESMMSVQNDTIS